MNLIDTILNLAGLLLWLAWRCPFPDGSRFGISSSIRPGPPSVQPDNSRETFRLYALLGLGAIIFIRALFFWHFGGVANFQPAMDLGAVVLPFRSDYLDRMLLFSLLSFGRFLLGFYLCLLLLSVANQRTPPGNTVLQWIRSPLGLLERWPAAIKLLLPFFAGIILWMLLNPVLVYFHILPRPAGGYSQVSEQAVVMGFMTYRAWKTPLLIVLFIHLITSYTYLGNHPLWEFVHSTAQNILRPLDALPLRLGRLDLVPLIAIALILLVSEGGSYLLNQVFRHLPL